MRIKRIYFGCDHAGFETKNQLKKDELFKQYEIIDLGTNSSVSCDYVDYALEVAKLTAVSDENLGILICGSGIGMCIAANKVPKIFAAAIYDEEMAKLAAEHNRANILCMGAKFTTVHKMLLMIKTFLSSDFKNARHSNRINKIINFEGSIKKL